MPVLLLVILCLLGSACDRPAPTPASTNATLILWNWTDYMTESVLDGFHRETGITVEQRFFDDDEILFGAVQGSDFDGDMFIISETLGREMIAARLVTPLDAALMPNLGHVDTDSLELCFRDGQLYSVPYLAGTTGIAVNTTHVGHDANSWSVLWDNRLAGHLAMLGNNFEVVAAASLKLGHGVIPGNQEQFAAVERELLRQRPLLKGYLSVEEIIDQLVSGELWAAQLYSGDALAAARRNPELRYIVPREGAARWHDLIMVARTSRHPLEAQMFMNYLHRPEVMAELSAALYFPTSNAQARKLIPAEVLADPNVYPPPEILARCAFFPASFPDGTSTQRISEIWNTLSAP